MYRLKIKAETFNKLTIEPEIEFSLTLDKKDQKIPPQIYEEFKTKIKQKLKVDNFEFRFISKDIEELEALGVKPNYYDLLSKTQSLIEKELSIYNQKIKDSRLKRVKELIEEKNISKAKELFSKINPNELSKFDFEEFKYIEFILKDDKDENTFRKYINEFKNNPKKIKEIYFSYIKYLEDKREEKKPYRIIEEFEKKYPHDELSSNELAIYYYLKGRNYYARGEFILALKNLSLAKEYARKDEKLLASIYNTATNSFTDNLFFNEALELANRALTIRKNLHLKEQFETKSLIGGIYLKKREFQKAFKEFQEVNEHIKDDRIYNYLAKNAIMLKDFTKAQEYIKKSQEFKNEKGFLTLIKFLFFYHTNQFKEMENLFNQTILLPEIRKKYDKVVVGFSYSLMAQKSFKEKKNIDAIKHLYRAIDYLLRDNYILEAFFISLYPKIYSLSKDEQKKFNNLIEEFALKEKMDLYVQKHSSQLKKYAKEFDININHNDKTNLEKLYYQALQNKNLTQIFNQFFLI